MFRRKKSKFQNLVLFPPFVSKKIFTDTFMVKIYLQTSVALAYKGTSHESGSRSSGDPRGFPEESQTKVRTFRRG